MTKTELRTHPEYQVCMNRIKAYKPGFRFTIPFHRMTRGQENAMNIILKDAQNLGLIESESIDLGWDAKGEFRPLEETYRRTEVQA